MPKVELFKTAQWDYEKGGKFWSQLQLVNCMRENESQEDSRKILQLIMLVYIVFWLFKSIQQTMSISKKFFESWEITFSVNTCLRFPLKQRDVFMNHAFKVCQPPKRKAEKVPSGLGGWLCMGSTRMVITLFRLFGIKHRKQYFHLREIKYRCTNNLLSVNMS